MLNMFRMLIHPSSGACDLFVELFHGLYCSGSMCVGVTLWMAVLTSETCWALNTEIIKQVTSSWSLFIQIPVCVSLRVDTGHCQLQDVNVGGCHESVWNVCVCCNFKTCPFWMKLIPVAAAIVRLYLYIKIRPTKFVAILFTGDPCSYILSTLKLLLWQPFTMGQVV